MTKVVYVRGVKAATHRKLKQAARKNSPPLSLNGYLIKILEEHTKTLKP